MIFVHVTPRHHSIIGPTRESCTTSQLHPTSSNFIHSPQPFHKFTNQHMFLQVSPPGVIKHSSTTKHTWRETERSRQRSMLVMIFYNSTHGRNQLCRAGRRKLRGITLVRHSKEQKRNEKLHKQQHHHLRQINCTHKINNSDLWLVKLVYRCSLSISQQAAGCLASRPT